MVEYIGCDYPGEGKHLEAEVFLYYKIKIGTEKWNLSTFIYKGLEQKEYPYSILKYEDKGLKAGDPPGEQKRNNSMQPSSQMRWTSYKSYSFVTKV
ncbi:hypothetical protein [Falsiporphyromonas endometrii]|uniref:Uncharacterized protein n=1 Tax=Falsiporphyromonas endometrii TaxID=1387297 RepID=A0ABV9K656_9PORP